MKFGSPISTPKCLYSLEPSRSDKVKSRRRTRANFMRELWNEIWLSHKYAEVPLLFRAVAQRQSKVAKAHESKFHEGPIE